jgi:hypothetical protein
MLIPVHAFDKADLRRSIFGRCANRAVLLRRIWSGGNVTKW